eukprot:scaffold4262_cov88-Phaeocystis_antarctica.AAC.1
MALCSTGVSGVSQVAACAMKISSIGPSQSRQLSTSGSAAAANSLHLAETQPGIARSLRALSKLYKHRCGPVQAECMSTRRCGLSPCVGTPLLKRSVGTR